MIKKVFSTLGVALLYLMSLLPFFILYLIADLLFVIIFYVTGYRRKVVQQNLSNAFPEKSAAERAKIEKEYFRYLADLVVETIKMGSISRSEVEKRMVVNNFNACTSGAFAEGRSVIAVVGHYGNWELASLKFGLVTDHPRITVYKPLSNRTFDEMFRKVRSRFGATLVPMKYTLRKMAQLRGTPSVLMLASDQTPSRDEATHFVQFLNQPTAIFLGAEKLARSLDAAVVFCDMRRVKRGHYVCNFELLFDHAKDTAEYEITNTHVQRLESTIRQEPPYWLWSHRRWKIKPEDVR